MKNSSFKNIGRLSIAILGLLCTIPALAQDQQTSPFLFRVNGGGVHQGEADFDNSSGGFNVDRGFVSASLDFGWSLRDSIGISVGGGKSSYEFADSSTFGGGKPWSKVSDSRISLTWRAGIGERVSLFIVPSLRVDGSSSASSGDSTTYGLFAAAAWRLDESLTIGPGIGVQGRLEDSTRLFPILAIDWDINERWNLSTGSGLAASRGPGLTLNYKFNEDWDLGVSGRYEDTEFRLGDQDAAAGGIGRDLSVPIVFLATLKPSPKIKFSVFTGIELFGTLKLKDANGQVLDESDYDPAPVFGATFEVRL